MTAQPDCDGTKSCLYYKNRVGQILGEPEDLLRDLAMEMQPEDGCLSVLGTGDLSTTAFTPDGVEYLHQLMVECRNAPRKGRGGDNRDG